MRGPERVARFDLLAVEMPWYVCSFNADAGFSEVEPLFREQERLIEADDWGGAESLWATMFSQLHLVADDDPDERIAEFLIRFQGDDVRLRYEPPDG